MVSSVELADVVADAVGIRRESARLHLKIIRAAGAISFKGYGRSAAAMVPLDASRLLLAVTGSQFAKDSLEVLRKFADLKPIGDPRDKTLEEFLAYRIELLTTETGYVIAQDVPDKLRRLPHIALELIWPNDIDDKAIKPCAILRWISFGEIRTLTFASQAHRKTLRKQSGSIVEDRYLALAMYPSAKMFHSRIVTREALIDIAYALTREQKSLR